MFKAQQTDGKGEVKGWLHYDLISGKWEIQNNNAIVLQWVEVIPSTLSMQTGQTDKNKKMIHGSIEIDGVMTKGGDRVKTDDDLYLGNVIFSKRWTGFIIENEIDNNMPYGIGMFNDDLEIIGKQYEEDNGNSKNK